MAKKCQGIFRGLVVDCNSGGIVSVVDGQTVVINGREIKDVKASDDPQAVTCRQEVANAYIQADIKRNPNKAG